MSKIKQTRLNRDEREERGTEKSRRGKHGSEKDTREMNTS